MNECGKSGEGCGRGRGYVGGVCVRVCLCMLVPVVLKSGNRREMRNSVSGGALCG